MTGCRARAQVQALARREEAARAARAAPGRLRPEQRHLLARLSLEAERAALARERAGEAREAVETRSASEAAVQCAETRRWSGLYDLLCRPRCCGVLETGMT